MPEDTELLHRYVADHSEAAFAELVRRHINLVYSVALRRVNGQAQLAEDVTQNVFTDLARKAPALTGHEVLPAWLFTSARYAAAQVMRTERRRQVREQEAHTMQEFLGDESSPADWDRLRPVLDAALDQLDARGREAVLLRFYQGRSFAEVGAALRLTDDAARMRVDRALDKLRSLLARRGVTSTAAALATILANQSGVAAPAGLAASVTGVALAASAATGAGVGAWLAFLTMSKIKIGIVGAIVAAGLATAVMELRTNRELRTELEALRAASAEVERSRPEDQSSVAVPQTPGTTNPDAAELGRLRARAAQLKARPEGVTDAQMKLTANCRNVGRATPAETLETQLWAARVRDTDAFMQSYVFSAETRAQLETFFAGLSDAVRARYGTPERLLGAYWLTMAKTQLPAAFQVLGQTSDPTGASDTVVVRVWMRQQSGEEKLDGIKLQHTATGWGMPVRKSPDAAWAKLAASIDPVTGEFGVAAK